MRTFGILAIGLFVTIAGVVGGAAVASPLAQYGPSARGMAFGAALLVAAVALVVALRGERAPGRDHARFARGVRPGNAATVPPTRSVACSATPQAVQALADSGRPVVAIARETRLPVDAVSLLLSLSSVSRQLQPPTA